MDQPLVSYNPYKVFAVAIIDRTASNTLSLTQTASGVLETPPDAFYYDNFNVADTSPLTGRVSWSQHDWIQSGTRGSAAGSGIVNREAYGGLHNNAFWFIDGTPPSNNYLLKGDFIKDGSSDRTWGLLSRFNLTSFTGYMASVDLGNLFLFRYNSSSSATQIGSSNYPNTSNDFRMEYECEGNTHRVYLYDLTLDEWVISTVATGSTRTALINVVDSTHSSGNVGLKIGRNSSTSVGPRTSAWEARELSRIELTASNTLSLTQSTVDAEKITPFVKDTFQAANGTAILSHTGDTGDGWTRHNSSFTANPTISSNQLNGSFNLYSSFFSDATMPSDDYIVQAVMDVTGSGDTVAGGGIMCRVTQGGTANFYAVRMRTNTIYLEKFDSGGTVLDTVSYTLSNEKYFLELSCIGTNIDLYIQRVSNGQWINNAGAEVGTKVVCISVSDSALTSGSFGFLGRQSDYRFDWILAYEPPTSGTDLTADSSIAFTQTADHPLITRDASNTISFTQLAETAGTEFTLTADNTLSFTQAVGRGGSLGYAASNTISFTQSGSVSIPLKVDLTASNTLSLTQTNDNGLLVRTAHNTITFTQSNVQAGEQELTAKDTITFTQSAGSGLISRTAHNYVEFTQQGLGGFVSVNATSLTASDTLSLSQEVNRSLALGSGTSLTASDTLSFTQKAIFPIDLTGENTLTLTQTADGNPGKTGTQTITFTQSAVAAFNRNMTASNTISFSQGTSGVNFRNGLPILGTGCDATKTYSPFSGGGTPLVRPVAPALNRKTDVEFFYPTGAVCSATTSIILRTPNFGDRDRNQYNRVNRESRGGSLRVYRDPQWPKIRTLVMDFSGVKDSEVSDILTFLEDTLGQQIGFRDWNSRVWYGLITNPDAAITRTGRANRNDIALEMEVTDTGLEVNACNLLELSQTASAVVE